MAKAKKRRRRNRGIKIPIAIVAGFAPYALMLHENWRTGGFSAFLKSAPKLVGYDGFSKKWNIRFLGDAGTWAVIGGMIAHKVATRFGINRAIANAGIPVVRI